MRGTGQCGPDQAVAQNGVDARPAVQREGTRAIQLLDRTRGVVGPEWGCGAIGWRYGSCRKLHGLATLTRRARAVRDVKQRHPANLDRRNCGVIGVRDAASRNLWNDKSGQGEVVVVAYAKILETCRGAPMVIPDRQREDVAAVSMVFHRTESSESVGRPWRQSPFLQATRPHRRSGCATSCGDC